MRRTAGLVALVIALLPAAACTSTGQPTASAGRPAGTGTAQAPGASESPGTSGNTGASASTGVSANTVPTRVSLPDPHKRMLLGAYVNLSGQTSTGASVAAREHAMGRPYDLEATYYNWTDPFPDAGEAAMAARGTTPLMAWYLPDKAVGSAPSLGEITSGADDVWITAQANAIKAFGHGVLLRLAPEMNGNWYGYSGDPSAYVAAWRHVHDVFTRVGAANVTWVWCPNLSPANWDPYYPGARYVDVIGVDGFSNTIYTWQKFQQMFDGFFAHFASFAPGKPQLVAETATDSGEGVPAARVGSAASFISGMRSYLKDVAGPKYDVVGVCWFDTDTNNGYNWRVDQTPGAWQAWLAMARDPYFGGRGT
jgi:Glycosyl hydrolase family 26